ncbi:MAG: hypothetical protein ACREQQ_04830 [Candidatus Binatia bacterium]
MKRIMTSKRILPSAALTALLSAANALALAPDVETLPGEVAGVLAAAVTAPSGPKLAPGIFRVGANRTRLTPAPALFGGTTWQTTGCFEIEQANPDLMHALPSQGHGWPFATPNCIYLGGFGIGPARAARSEDAGGVWVRSIAISNGADTFVYQIIDATGYFYRYQGAACADCGIHDLRNQLSAASGIPVDNVVMGSTHTHAGPDAYGGWGGLPPWYWKQLHDSFLASGKQAVANLEEATIQVGMTLVRDFNGERRDHYYSPPDFSAGWLQAKRTGDGAVIATLANYAGHPTIVGDPILHADWPGAAARRFESLYGGGVGILFEGGLGNMSVSGRGGASDSEAAENTGKAFAETLKPDIDLNSRVLTTNDMTANVALIQHPVMTNQGLAALGSLGLFSREFIPGTPGAAGPGVYHWRKSGETGEVRSCDSASAIQIQTLVGAHRIGELGIGFAPGEIFSNVSSVVKSKRRNNKAMLVFGQTNDSLGYIMQSFEFDYKGTGVAAAATEYGTMTGEYEEVFALDHCLGDHVLQQLLDSTGALGL